MPEVWRYFYKTLEPVHAGAGGYRLGRVDKTICREPGTNLPKIPGTSISGAARTYAALKINRPEAAGAGRYTGSDKDKACPVFYTFGHASDEGKGYAGTVIIGDAHLLFFPIYSTSGRVWITSRAVLEQAGRGLEHEHPEQTVLTGWEAKEGFNLAWLWVEANETVPFKGLVPPQGAPPAAKIVILPDDLFASLVNSQLEVRTSVTISPKTGTAEGGLLFSYEAIPRDTYLMQEVVIDNYRKTNGKNEDGEKGKGPFPPTRTDGWAGPQAVLEYGLQMMGTLGVGGMGTRGFGRMEWLKDAAEEVAKT